MRGLLAGQIRGERDEGEDTMTPEQKAAYIVAQAALLNAEIEAMKAANLERVHRGEAMAYSEYAFLDIINEYSILDHNNIMQYLRD